MTFGPAEVDSQRFATGPVRLDCRYRTGPGRSADKLYFSLMIFQGSTPETAYRDAEQSFARLVRWNASRATDPTPDPVFGVGDQAAAYLLPGKGVKLIVRADNATVLLEYGSTRDVRRCLDDAKVYARDALAHLR